MKEWIKINKNRSNLPIETDNDKMYLFINWHNRWKTPVTDYYETWENVKAFRNYELQNNYTHYMKLNPPK